MSIKQWGRRIAAVALALFWCNVAWGMEFAPFRTFTPYESLQMQPFSATPKFEEKPFDTYAPGPQDPDVKMPPYKGRPYGTITPPQEPDVHIPTLDFRTYKNHGPMSPIKQDPMRPMPQGNFAPFKPLGK